MLFIDENDAKVICERFFEVHRWERLQVINHSQVGLNPLIILNNEGEVPSVHLYDNYQSLITKIRPLIEKDLQANNGYSESFYLSYEDIDNLDFQNYVSRERDTEKIIDLANRSLNNY